MVTQVSLADAYSAVHLPAKVILAVTEKPKSGYNLITLEWFMRTSINPVMFAISVGHSRYSFECLEQHKFFNLAFPSTELQPLVKLAGSTSGRDTDKFLTGNVDFQPGKLHKLPVLKEAVVNLECEVISQIRSGDHTIYIGQVHYSWLNNEKKLYFLDK